ncbi:MAG: hypothetical protein ACREKL_10780 [Chthoniobacterales bacterium]
MGCLLSLLPAVSQGAERDGKFPGIDAKAPDFLIATQSASAAKPVTGVLDQIEQEALQEANNSPSVLNYVLGAILFITLAALAIVIGLHVREIKKRPRSRRRRRRRSSTADAGDLDPA